MPARPAHPTLLVGDVSLAIDGHLRTRLRWAPDDPNVDFIGRNDGFSLQVARLGVHALLDPRIEARIELDGALDERSRVNAPQGRLVPGLRDAYLGIRGPAGGALRVGRFETLLRTELTPTHANVFVTLPIDERGVAAGEGWEARGLTLGHSLGVSYGRRTAPAAGGAVWEVAVQNGGDELDANNDNDAFAISVAGGYQTPNLVAVVGARYNPRTRGDLPFQQTEVDFAGTAGLYLARGPLALGLGGAVIRTQFETIGSQAQLALGGHAGISYAVLNDEEHQASLGYRFGLLDSSNLVLVDRVMEHTAAFSYAVPAMHLRVSAGAVLSFEQAARSVRNHRAEAALDWSF